MAARGGRRPRATAWHLAPGARARTGSRQPGRSPGTPPLRPRSHAGRRAARLPGHGGTRIGHGPQSRSSPAGGRWAERPDSAGPLGPAGARDGQFGEDDPMRYGIVLTTGDPRVAADLAADAEDAGWDGVFTFDAISIGSLPLFDPWIVLAAVAMRTTRVTLGAMVFAPARRRPWTLARQAISLDILSNGRLVLPVGLGTLDDAGFGNVGEPTSAAVRARRLDETLTILDGLQSGEPFAFEGEQYRFGPMTFLPRPVQRPRIPVWVVGAWPHERSMRRAAGWDGIVVQAQGPADGPSPMPGSCPRSSTGCAASARPTARATRSRWWSTARPLPTTRPRPPRSPSPTRRPVRRGGSRPTGARRRSRRSGRGSSAGPPRA